MGHVPGDDSGVMRMQDEAGYAPADRRWSDVKSDARTIGFIPMLHVRNLGHFVTNRAMGGFRPGTKTGLHAGKRNNPRAHQPSPAY